MSVINPSRPLPSYYSESCQIHPVSLENEDEEMAAEIDFQEILKTDFDPVITTPGQVITTDSQFMRGHGTWVDDHGRTISLHQGSVNRVNKLLSVLPLKSRYKPQIGDLVVGRVMHLLTRRWKIDIGTSEFAILALSSIHLPGGIQRRKLNSDELQMRSFFQEGDLVVAEIHAQHSDSSITLHARSTKYGKLRNGLFCSVPPYLVDRSKRRMITLSNNIHLTIGCNGYIWISRLRKSIAKEASELASMDSTKEVSDYSDLNDQDISSFEQIEMIKTRNIILALAQNEVRINEATILQAFEVAQAIMDIGTLNYPDDQRKLIDSL